jgi:hypothetical protein
MERKINQVFTWGKVSFHYLLDFEDLDENLLLYKTHSNIILSHNQNIVTSSIGNAIPWVSFISTCLQFLTSNGIRLALHQALLMELKS